MKPAEIKQVKAAVRERDGHRCTICERSGIRLDVHRLSPRSEYSVDGCVTLCKHCHGKQPKSPYRSGHFNGTRRIVFLKERLAIQLDALADANASDLMQEVNRAVREMLEREGKWPPKSS